MASTNPATSAFARRADSLLVIIDIQERLMPAMAHRDTVIENAKRLIAFADIIDLPIVVTEQEKLGPTILDLSRHRHPVRPIPKVVFNCFLSEQFADTIRESGRKTLILIGVEAHICVAQTALHAAPQLNVHVVRDAISSRTTDNWNIAVERMRSGGVTITSTEMIIYELLERAGTDEFKSTLTLVK